MSKADKLIEAESLIKDIYAEMCARSFHKKEKFQFIYTGDDGRNFACLVCDDSTLFISRSRDYKHPQEKDWQEIKDLNKIGKIAYQVAGDIIYAHKQFAIRFEIDRAVRIAKEQEEEQKNFEEAEDFSLDPTPPAPPKKTSIQRAGEAIKKFVKKFAKEDPGRSIFDGERFGEKKDDADLSRPSSALIEITSSSEQLSAVTSDSSLDADAIASMSGLSFGEDESEGASDVDSLNGTIRPVSHSSLKPRQSAEKDKARN